MRRTRLVPFALAVVLAGGLALAARPASTQEGEMGGMENMPPMPQPTAEHQHLMDMVGEWEGTITMLGMPGVPETPTPASETIRAIGGFWIVSDFHCQFLGMPFHGHGTQGYDAEKGQYVGTWIDSFGSPMAMMDGEWKQDQQKVVMRWMAADMTGAIVPHRSEMTHDDDSYKMDFYTDGKHSMVIEMERKGSM